MECITALEYEGGIVAVDSGMDFPALLADLYLQAAEVLEGLSEGERIIVFPPETVNEGSSVRAVTQG